MPMLLINLSAAFAFKPHLPPLPCVQVHFISASLNRFIDRRFRFESALVDLLIGLDRLFQTPVDRMHDLPLGY